MAWLGPQFFARAALEVARDLLGATLQVRGDDGLQAAGRLVETEAYGGREDAASHAHRGPTPRSSIMFGPPGIAYVYLIYGVHHCLNFVTETEGQPGAVLIRALEPLEGLTLMAHRRGLDPARCRPPSIPVHFRPAVSSRLQTPPPHRPDPHQKFPQPLHRPPQLLSFPLTRGVCLCCRMFGVIRRRPVRCDEDIAKHSATQTDTTRTHIDTASKWC